MLNIRNAAVMQVFLPFLDSNFCSITSKISRTVVVCVCTGLCGLGEEVFKISRVGWGRVGSYLKITKSHGSVGSDQEVFRIKP